MKPSTTRLRQVVGKQRPETFSRAPTGPWSALDGTPTTRQHTSRRLESLGVLAGGIAHDFNNLLVGILGNADLALKVLPDDTPARTYVDEVLQSARRAADLSAQMLACSGRGTFVTRPLNLALWAKDLVRLLKVSITPQAVLRCKLPTYVPAVEADPAQIRQLITNLMTNASDSLGDEAGLITLSIGAVDCDDESLRSAFLCQDLKPGRHVFLEISDTGCGISQADMERIFDPFFTTKTSHRGMGLAAVLGIVRGHGGALWVDSSEDRGSTFRIHFPATDQPVVNVPALTRRDGHWQGQGRVMVVDDEDVVRSVARVNLEQAGFEVETLAEGKHAIQAFRGDPDGYRLVLLDMTMPRLSGEEVARELREIRPDVKIVLSSGYSEQLVSTSFAYVGEPITAFLPKPYLPYDLIAKVREALGE